MTVQWRGAPLKRPKSRVFWVASREQFVRGSRRCSLDFFGESIPCGECVLDSSWERGQIIGSLKWAQWNVPMSIARNDLLSFLGKNHPHVFLNERIERFAGD